MPAELPAPLDVFVGRETELRELQELVVHIPLLTLAGPGGVGKTRLALEVARGTADRFDEVHLIELASLEDPRLLPPILAGGFGIQGDGEQILDRLAQRLSGDPVLLVLDNCEHLLPAAAVTVGELAHRCPNLRILATSRDPLGAPGERIWDLAPLPLPGPGDPVESADAVRLFVERAQASHRRFRITEENSPFVAQVCARLEGLPLAIEMAASRVRHLTPLEIAERLEEHLALLAADPDDLPARHRSLAAVMDWSYDLLSPGERRLLARLAVFPDGCTLRTAESVGGLEGATAVDVLGRLVDRSLVSRREIGGRSRYRVPETVRQYALERARQAGEMEEVEDTFLGWALAFVRGEASAEGPPDLPALAAEGANLRLALARVLERDELPGAVALVTALGPLWYARGPFSEGREAIEQVLAHRERLPPAALPPILGIAGNLARLEGDLERATALEQERLTLSRTAGDWREEAASLSSLGSIAGISGHHPEARRFFEESLDAWEAAGAGPELAGALLNLAITDHMQSDFAAARPRIEKALALFRDAGHRAGEANALQMLAFQSEHQGDPRVRELHEESLQIRREVGDTAGVINSLINLANLDARSGDTAGARERYTEALGLAEKIGAAPKVGVCLYNLGALEELEGDLVTARRLLERAAVIHRRHDDPRYLAASLQALTEVSRQCGDLAEARARVEEAMAIARKTRNPHLIARTTGSAASVALEEGELAEASELLAESQGLIQEIGEIRDLARSRILEARLLVRKGDTEAARACCREALAECRRLEDPRGVADALEVLAQVEVDHADMHLADALEAYERAGGRIGMARTLEALADLWEERDPTAAATLLAVAETLSAAAAGALRRSLYKRAEALRARLERDAFARAWEEGARLPPGQVVAFARGLESRRGAAAERIFRRDGDVWTVTFGGRSAQLRHVLGFSYLRFLLANPGEEFHALRLQALVAGAAGEASAMVMDPALALEGGGGEVLLDEKAQAALRDHLAFLREQIEEAEAFGDAGRAARAREELEAITEQTAKSLGLRGRSRRASSPAERARVNVTRSIRSAIRRVAAVNPALGAHLEATTSTGAFSAYCPDPSVNVAWRT